jgi:hypothetical protein
VNFKQAMSSNDVEQWLKIMNEELYSIKKHDVWKLTDLPSKKKKKKNTLDANGYWERNLKQMEALINTKLGRWLKCLLNSSV